MSIYLPDTNFLINLAKAGTLSGNPSAYLDNLLGNNSPLFIVTTTVRGEVSNNFSQGKISRDELDAIQSWINRGERGNSVEVYPTGRPPGNNNGERSIDDAIRAQAIENPVILTSDGNVDWDTSTHQRFNPDVINTIEGINKIFLEGGISGGEYVQLIKDLKETVPSQDLIGRDGNSSTILFSEDDRLIYILPSGDTMITLPDGSVIIRGADGSEDFYTADQAIEGQSGFDVVDARNSPLCFLPGTPITLADGVTTKPIEEIAVGDEVLSYTDDGTLVPGRVTATSSKTASIVLDWFGLGVTPGHVTLCGHVAGEEETAAGPFMGRHVPLIDILCADGAVVRQDGSLVRAVTNEPVGSRADAFVRLAYSRTGEELKAGVSHEASIRVGTKLITGEGNTVRVLDVIEANGYAFDEETGLVSRPLDDGTPGIAGPLPFFGQPPKPEDHVLNRSGTTLEAIHTAGEWEEGQPGRMVPGRVRRRLQRSTDGNDRGLKLN